MGLMLPTDTLKARASIAPKASVGLQEVVSYKTRSGREGAEQREGPTSMDRRREEEEESALGRARGKVDRTVGGREGGCWADATTRTSQRLET